MNEHQKAAAPAGLTLSDVLYVLFRHKWKIALISSLGFIAVVVVHFVLPHVYQSEAVLLIKYVPPSKSPDQVMAGESSVKPVDVGEAVINTELEILTSQDLAQEVAAAIGPEKLLTKDAFLPKKLSVGPETETDPLLAAAKVVKKALAAEVKKRGTVIHVTFQHTDRAIVQPVLAKALEIYQKRHLQIHGEGGTIDEIWKKETEQLGKQLQATEAELITAKTNANISSLEDDKRSNAQEIARIRDEIFLAESDLAEREAAFEGLTNLLHGRIFLGTNVAHATNEIIVPLDKLAEYRRVCRLLDYLVRKGEDYERDFTPSSTLVRENRDRISANEALKKKLEDENPGLLTARIVETRTAGTETSVGSRPDLLTEKIRIEGLKKKIVALNGQMALLKAEAAKVNQAEGRVKSLQIKKELEETRYRTMSANLDQSRIAEAVGAGHVSGIKAIQEPSPPATAPSKRYKIMALALFGPIVAAFALAFFIELYLDQSLKRPIEVETKLHLPLFMAIPRLKLNGQHPNLTSGPARPLLTEGNAVENAAHDPSRPVPAEAQLTPWDPRNILRPFSEALRDRLITHFEVKNLTRKPKLVAVTGCAEGSGVSTVAAGLAASLSETGEGNVLLVDMNQQDGAAHHFFHGELACGLDEALEMEKRDSALVQDNLYVVMEGTDNQLPRVLPKRFNSIVPRLKASDYDYIIFDMPPVSQISITPRVAKFMDMVLMVVESEKTDRQVVQRASAMLAETKTDVGIVLNKGRRYIPKRLQQEL
jgi:uncharacterized protein involved in exopolysaccharide biosynthesis/Mrp family chromosome partitioning ATPase